MNEAHSVVVMAHTMSGGFEAAPTADFDDAYIVHFVGHPVSNEGIHDESVSTDALIILSLEMVAMLMINLTASAAQAGAANQLRDLMRDEVNRRRAKAN